MSLHSSVGDLAVTSGTPCWLVGVTWSSNIEEDGRQTDISFDGPLVGVLFGW